MGYYLEAEPGSTKEEWLAAHGTPAPVGATEKATIGTWLDKPADQVLICLVDNGPFRAAAIITGQHEFEEFGHPSYLLTDPRPRTWWYVPLQCVMERVHQALRGGLEETICPKRYEDEL